MDNEILIKAIDTWGEDSQIMMAVEECSELIKSICKYYRYPDVFMNDKSVIDEIADVMIMCEQLKIIFGAEEVENQIKFKMERLEKRLSEKSD